MFDNAGSYDDLRHLIPSPPCRSVVTARNRLTYPDDSVLPLEPFTPADSLALLRKLVGRPIDEADAAVAAELCAEVGEVPLAVAHVSLYAKDSGLGLGQVLRHVRQVAASVGPLVHRVGAYARPESVVGALQLVQRQQLDRPSRRTLSLLALLAPDRVPRELLGDGPAIEQLRGLAMVNPGKELVSLHRLVQMVALAKMSVEERLSATRELVEALIEYTRSFSREDRATWDRMKAAAPHPEALAAKWREGVPGVVEATLARAWLVLSDRLFNYYLWSTSDFLAAAGWAQRQSEAAVALAYVHPTGILLTARRTAEALSFQGKNAAAEAVLHTMIPD